ncbi:MULTISPECIES: lysophospholipid acyltransferase family protein [Jeotgalicoccus]|jgi:1-acyl-sn-glycerol-3-phosphate acyltransferase|uniref:1-acyl-sn-glycerol-3-phosphate acyltransferase n=1 Tax=Jeotgalicoccus nanhaiensis TaxID=568603 RepID=A0ABR9XWL7_9STAP|nr:lysophospholipid acyltransferase family protein [Jeotgalicoccus nanhaiensis]MBF0753364.1 1-acyl-sn-glycerol-3-phosphate acyltransferase [Jeotgalicoccus nanhaiensis]TFU62528.1 1-acyl-sn-glycerol-3-phosphate acyltransferase [Jeotgalicoccus nanhaiensis]
MIYESAKFLVKCYYKLRFKITVIGEDRVPSSGPVMLVSNHISDFDPPLIGLALERQLSFFAKSELFELPVIGKIFPSLNAIPVSRGKSDRAALKTSINALKEDRCLLIFPEGSRNKEDVKKLQPLQQGASFIASKSEAPIVPVIIKGEYNRKKGVTIVFGKPIDTKEFLEAGNTRKDLTLKLEENLNNLLFSE